MRLRLLTFLAPILSSIICGTNADASAGAGDLYPPGYLPLVNRANALLTAGQFSDAAKSYSEALGALRIIYTIQNLTIQLAMAPNDYLLYYKRATAYYSVNRHPQALEDFDRVLELTSSSFNKAYLMKARIYAKDGIFASARDSLKRYGVAVQDGGPEGSPWSRDHSASTVSAQS